MSSKEMQIWVLTFLALATMAKASEGDKKPSLLKNVEGTKSDLKTSETAYGYPYPGYPAYPAGYYHNHHHGPVHSHVPLPQYKVRYPASPKLKIAHYPPALPYPDPHQYHHEHPPVVPHPHFDHHHHHHGPAPHAPYYGYAKPSFVPQPFVVSSKTVHPTGGHAYITQTHYAYPPVPVGYHHHHHPSDHQNEHHHDPHYYE